MPSSLKAGLPGKHVLWIVVPALASAPALGLSPKWQLFYVAAVFIVAPSTLMLRDARPWLLLAGAVTAFDVTKVVGEPTATPTAGSLAIAAIDVPIVMMLAMTAVRGSSGGGARATPGLRRVLLVGAALVTWLALAATGRHPAAHLSQALDYARMFALLTVVAACATDARSVRWALAGLFLSLLAQSALAAAQFVAGSSFGLYGNTEAATDAGTFTRSGGTLNPTVLSEFIGAVAPLVLAAAFTARRRAAALGLFALFGGAMAASLMTLTRAGLINLGIPTGVVCAAALGNVAVPSSRKAAVGIALPVLALVLALSFSDALGARFRQIDLELDGPEGRAAQIAQARRMIAAHPLLGVGPGNYVAVMGQYGPILPYPVHNKLLLVAAEAGLPAAVLFGALWLFLALFLARRAVRAAGRERILHAAAAATILATLINMNIDVYATPAPSEMALCLVAGLGLGFRARRQRPRTQGEQGWETPWSRSARAR